MATLPPPIIFTITDAGKNAALSGIDAGLSLNLTHLAVGSGKYEPTGSETALKSEIKRQAIVSGDIETQSHTLRFSSMLHADTITEVYEMGLVTDDNVLFAVASTTSNTPLLTIHPDITFVGSFGLSLDDIDVANITVTTDPNGSLALVVMENHLAAVDPHPQYLNAQRFQMLMRGLIPIGYPYYTHDTANPKPLFDELLGLETFWRRITGKIMVATDPNDPFINDVGIVLGQRGMTELANNQRPHVYPLQTTNLFERYDPSKVIETVWSVRADKNSVKEGGAIVFTVTANNLPDGQILNWTVKEGALNVDNNDITAPDKTESGTVIIKNGQAVISFTTTDDDNLEEPQKHVRLTVGAPANLSINVPINDTGHHETVIHISESTYDGIVLDEYYKTQAGRYPKANELVRFIVDEGVDIVAPSTATGAIVDGSHWPETAEIIIENHGRILGRGGDGGRSARPKKITSNSGGAFINSASSSWFYPPENGRDGGVAIVSQNKTAIENYGIVASGGGGGGGMGAYKASDYNFVVGGGGAGGGAPLGLGSPNESTYPMYKIDNQVTWKKLYRPTSPICSLAFQAPGLAIAETLNHSSKETASIDYDASYQVANDEQSCGFFFPLAADKSYAADGDATYFILSGGFRQTGGSYELSIPLKMSQSATLDLQGMGGSNIVGVVTSRTEMLRSECIKDVRNPTETTRGGDGGYFGDDGLDGQIDAFYSLNGTGFNLAEVSESNLLWSIPSAKGGKAGYVYQGNVTINNLSGGQTKGRMS